MPRRIMIELTTEEAAASLEQELAPSFGGVAIHETRVYLDSDQTQADRFVVDLLDAVKAWVDKSGLESVQVALDGRSYTLAADPRPRTPA